MAKGSGTTRTTGPASNRGTRTIRESFVDEDTGERIVIERVVDLKAKQREQREKEREERLRNEIAPKIDNLRGQWLDKEADITATENEIRSLNEQRRIFESDMEDELGRLSGAQQDKRAAWYGAKLNSIDKELDTNSKKLVNLRKQSDTLYRKMESLENKLYRR